MRRGSTDLANALFARSPRPKAASLVQKALLAAFVGGGGAAIGANSKVGPGNEADATDHNVAVHKYSTDDVESERATSKARGICRREGSCHHEVSTKNPHWKNYTHCDHHDLVQYDVTRWTLWPSSGSTSQQSPKTKNQSGCSHFRVRCDVDGDKCSATGKCRYDRETASRDDSKMHMIGAPQILSTSASEEQVSSDTAYPRWRDRENKDEMSYSEAFLGSPALNNIFSNKTAANKALMAPPQVTVKPNNAKNSKKLNGNTQRNANTGDNNDENAVDDDYPCFTQYHRSLLKTYLTPEIWHALRSRQTSFHTTIEDIVRPGLALPLGADPPRRVGILAGDAECYTVFRELFDPIICDYHGIKSYEDFMDPELPMEKHFLEDGGAGGGSIGIGRGSGKDAKNQEKGRNQDVIKSGSDSWNEDDLFEADDADGDTFSFFGSKQKPNLKRHCTIINNPLLVTDRKADPEGKYILSTRIRVARSLDGIAFPTTMSRSDRRKVQRLVHECTQNFKTPLLFEGTYIPILSMTSDENLRLIERHILFDNPNEWTIAAGLGRDWPDGRALYANVLDVHRQTPDFMIWVNEEDHLRIMCLRNGGDIQGVFTTLMSGVRELERELRIRGWHFAYDGRLGYLTSCPTNVGTTMRASVHVRLAKLGRLPGFHELVQRLKLEARGKHGETDRQYTGIFDISNAERLGKSEVHLINVMVEGVAKLIELERRLEAGEKINFDEVGRE